MDGNLLLELNKLFNLNLVDFSNDQVYKDNLKLWNGELSRFLLELIFKELDSFLFNFSSECHLKLFEEKYYYLSNTKSSKKSFIPVKLDKVLLKFKNLRSFLNFKNLKAERYFSDFYVEKESFYEQIIFNVRYLDLLLLGVKGSKVFVSNITDKVSNFVKSRIHFDIQNLESFSYKENSIFFAGFNIRLCFVSFIYML